MKESTSITVFNYENAGVAFKNYDGSAMINATQMAKAFGKSPREWLRQDCVNEFLRKLSDFRQKHITQLVVTRKGNFADKREQGTWMHEDVALEFARWLSPMFAIWCNDRVKEILKGGTPTDDPLEDGDWDGFCGHLAEQAGLTPDDPESKAILNLLGDTRH